jgi:predicted nuclease with TOPRIM domain
LESGIYVNVKSIDAFDLQNQLATQKDKFLNRNFEEEQYKSQVKEKNSQLSRYVTEIQLLNVQNSKMAEDMEAMTQELEVAIDELDRYFSLE